MVLDRTCSKMTEIQASAGNQSQLKSHRSWLVIWFCWAAKTTSKTYFSAIFLVEARGFRVYNVLSKKILLKFQTVTNFTEVHVSSCMKLGLHTYKPGSYFLQMRSECWRHKFATNNSQQFSPAQHLRISRRVLASNSHQIRFAFAWTWLY